MRPRRPPELHVVLSFEADWPTLRLVAFTGEDEERLRIWLRETPSALLHTGIAVFALLNDLLDGRAVPRSPDELERLYEELLPRTTRSLPREHGRGAFARGPVERGGGAARARRERLRGACARAAGRP